MSDNSRDMIYKTGDTENIGNESGEESGAQIGENLFVGSLSPVVLTDIAQSVIHHNAHGSCNDVNIS